MRATGSAALWFLPTLLAGTLAAQESQVVRVDREIYDVGDDVAVRYRLPSFDRQRIISPYWYSGAMNGNADGGALTRDGFTTSYTAEGGEAGEFHLDTRNVSLRWDPFRELVSVEFAADGGEILGTDRFLVRRQVVRRPGSLAMRSGRRVLAASAIEFAVPGAAGLLEEHPERLALVLVRPGLVFPGGAVSIDRSVFGVRIAEGRSEFRFPLEGSFDLTPGLYEARLVGTAGAVLDRKAFEVVLPATEGAIRIEPALEGPHPWDAPPAISVELPADRRTFARGAAIQLVRIGREGSLQLVEETGLATQARLDVPEALAAGLYEARLVWRPHPAAGDDLDWTYVLETRRFEVGGKPPSARIPPPLEPEIPYGQIELRLPAGPVAAREAFEVEIALPDGLELEGRGIWAILHRRAGYTRRCLAHDLHVASPAATLFPPPEDDRRRFAGPSGLFGSGPGLLPSLPPSALGFPLAFPFEGGIEVLSSDPLAAHIPEKVFRSGDGAAGEGAIRRTGATTLEVVAPWLPGDYDLSLFRGPEPARYSGRVYPRAELLARAGFVVHAPSAPGALRLRGSEFLLDSDRVLDPLVLQLSPSTLEAPDRRVVLYRDAQILPGGAWAPPRLIAEIEVPASVSPVELEVDEYEVRDMGDYEFRLLVGPLVLARVPFRVRSDERPKEWPPELGRYGGPLDLPGPSDLDRQPEAWLLPRDVCAEPEFAKPPTFRIVLWRGGDPESLEDDEYEPASAIHPGFPFLLEAVFEEAPPDPTYRARVGPEARIALERTEVPTLYRSGVLVLTARGEIVEGSR